MLLKSILITSALATPVINLFDQYFMIPRSLGLFIHIIYSRMLNSQMQLKKASQTPKSREFAQKRPTLAPVMDFNKKNKKESHDAFPFTSKVIYFNDVTKIIDDTLFVHHFSLKSRYM